MTTPRFRLDNTEGYSQADLDRLNEMFDREIAAADIEPDDKMAYGLFKDYIAEQVQQMYDLYPERHGL